MSIEKLKLNLHSLIREKESINQEDCNAKMLEFMAFYISQRTLGDYPLHIRSGLDLHGTFPYGYSGNSKLLSMYTNKGEMIKISLELAIKELEGIGFLIKRGKTDSPIYIYSIDIP